MTQENECTHVEHNAQNRGRPDLGGDAEARGRPDLGGDTETRGRPDPGNGADTQGVPGKQTPPGTPWRIDHPDGGVHGGNNG